MLSNKIAIVTGCGGGIGSAIMNLFASNGAIVYAIDKVEGSIKPLLPQMVIPCYMDITDSQQVRDVVTKAWKEQGHIDILVNNAGVMIDAMAPMITQEQIDLTFGVNVFSMIYFIKYVSKIMRRQHSGSIINAASIMGISGNEAQIVYSASKGAVISLTKSAAKEFARDNIRVNAIAPGTIATNLLKDIPLEKLNHIKSRIYMGALGTPESVANAYLFLASDMSNYISGQILGVDGMMIN